MTIQPTIQGQERPRGRQPLVPGVQVWAVVPVGVASMRPPATAQAAQTFDQIPGPGGLTLVPAEVVTVRDGFATVRGIGSGYMGLRWAVPAYQCGRDLAWLQAELRMFAGIRITPAQRMVLRRLYAHVGALELIAQHLDTFAHYVGVGELGIAAREAVQRRARVHVETCEKLERMGLLACSRNTRRRVWRLATNPMGVTAP